MIHPTEHPEHPEHQPGPAAQPPGLTRLESILTIALIAQAALEIVVLVAKL